MSARLNPPQKEAVTHGGGPILVLAGAGSGKTRVITHRIGHLVKSGVPARAIAALTFTNKAAEEMRGRVARLVGGKKVAGELTMGTFHSLGLSILKAERKALGMPRGFVIYDTADQLGVVREILRRIDVGGRRFDAKAILTRISLAKNAFIGPEEYQPADFDEYDEITAEVYPRYCEAMSAYAAVDFDDLITATVHLLRSHAEVRARWSSKFRYVLVDEYQDTNRAQLMMIRELVAEHHNLCVVGDDDQSIYSWRGAEPANILRFAQMFDGARVVKLEQNYRSTPNILAAANAVIANNTDRHGKVLWSDKPGGEPIEAVIAPSADAEARFVAAEIARLREKGRRWSDIAVLYRSNLQTRILEEELRTREIPYVLRGGQQFYERKEVKDLIAYLRLALNPRDEISMRRVINYPARGIGGATVSRLAEYAEARRCTLWRAACEAEQAQLAPRSRDAVASFVLVVKRLAQAVESRGVLEATRELIEHVDLYGDIRAASPSLAAAQRRIDNVEMLLGSLKRQQERAPGADSLQEYLRQLSLASSEDESVDSRGKVTLTTLHGSKGLEFPVVFLIGMEEELLPHARTLRPQSTDVGDPEHAADVSEERRLAYVGITRAQEKLYLCRAVMRHRHGKARPTTPSRFLLEIPAELLTERDVDAEDKEPVQTEELRDFFRSFALD